MKRPKVTVICSISRFSPSYANALPPSPRLWRTRRRAGQTVRSGSSRIMGAYGLPDIFNKNFMQIVVVPP